MHTGGQGDGAGQNPPVHPQTLVEREHCRDGDEERHRSGSIEVHHGRKQGGADHDTCRVLTHGAQDADDDRIEHSGIRDDAEIEDREDEHAGNRRDVLDALDDEGAGLVSESAHQRCDHRHDD